MPACRSSALQQAEQQNEASSKSQVFGVARVVVAPAVLLVLLVVVALGSQDHIRGASPFLARHLRGSEVEETSIDGNLAEDEESRFLATEMQEEEEDAANVTVRPGSDDNVTSGTPGSNTSDGGSGGGGAAVSGAACAATGKDCHACQCCSMWQDSCFETKEGQATCMRSCTPDDDQSCKTPFAPWQAQARETNVWPDIVAVCAPGMALVSDAAFTATYEGSCDAYCQEGAGQAVAPEWAQFWVSVPIEGAGDLGHCPGEEGNEAAPAGILCFCSFPDRL